MRKKTGRKNIAFQEEREEKQDILINFPSGWTCFEEEKDY